MLKTVAKKVPSFLTGRGIVQCLSPTLPPKVRNDAFTTIRSQQLCVHSTFDSSEKGVIAKIVQSALLM